MIEALEKAEEAAVGEGLIKSREHPATRAYPSECTPCLRIRETAVGRT